MIESLSVSLADRLHYSRRNGQLTKSELSKNINHSFLVILCWLFGCWPLLLVSSTWLSILLSINLKEELENATRLKGVSFV